MQSDPTSTRRFRAMSPDDVISKLDEIMNVQAILKLQQLGTAAPDPVSALGMDKASFCKLAALKYNSNYSSNAQKGEVEFHAPVVSFPSTTTSIIITTYFNSRVDPLRCYKHPLGHMAADNWSYLEHWWISVFRSGLSAIIFHEALSDDFVAKLTTEKIKFQKVTLAHHTWSLCDERWAVYSKWLTSPASQFIEYALQMDLSDTVVARDPFSLFDQGLLDDEEAETSSSNNNNKEEEESPLLFKKKRLILHREHTMPAPLSRIRSAQGKPWDTVKPLYLHFSRLHRVLLFDDDDHKVHDGERDNVVLIPGWEKDDPGDKVIEAVVESVKSVLGGLGDDADLRLYRCALEDAIREAVMAQELGEKVKV